MGIDFPQEAPGFPVEDQHLPAGGGIGRPLLLEHGDHHIVRALIHEGNQGFLPVEQEIAVRVLLHGLFGHFPDEVPGGHVGHLVSKLFHEIPVDVEGLGAPHIGHGVLLPADNALLQEFRNDFLPRRPLELQFLSAQAVQGIVHQVVQGHHHVASRHIGGDMVRVGDADVGRRVGRDVGDHVVVNLVIVRIGPDGHGDVGIEGLEVFDGLPVNLRLGFVGVVLRPEDDFHRFAFVEPLGNHERAPVHLAVAGRQHRNDQEQNHRQRDPLFHPFVPPLETPAMIFFRKIRKRMISGALMTTTAAIMAGVFSRPAPFSRSSWMPLETRK